MIPPHRASWFVLFIFVALVPTVAGAESDALKVMSFNIRFGYEGSKEEKPENNWYDPSHPRRDRAIQVIRDVKPDIMGVQEALNCQLDDFKKAMPELAFYGLGRDDGKSAGEFSGIFYRKDRFEQEDAGSFWLSDTPEKPGTSFYKAPKACARMASWVRLRDKSTGQQFLVLNSHWDHISGDARRKSASLIRERLAKLADEEPVIAMGDFNSPEDSPAFETLLRQGKSAEIKLLDSYRELHAQRLPDESTYNDWAGKTDGSRIDFILHNERLKPADAEIVRTNYDGRWPSDHYPITATLQLVPKSK